MFKVCCIHIFETWHSFLISSRDFRWGPKGRGSPPEREDAILYDTYVYYVYIYSLHVFLCTCTCAYKYLWCMYACAYVYVYMCTCVYICIYIHIIYIYIERERERERYIHTAIADSLRGLSVNFWSAQINLAWPLRKDDTHTLIHVEKVYTIICLGTP